MTIQKIVVLTGAGISAESGLGTFRDKDGIWTKYPLEDLATPEGFVRNPEFVHGFYNDRRDALKTARPHDGHEALARLEREWCSWGRSFMLVTQNVDNLHEQAGSSSERLIHMHGELAKVRCGACGTITQSMDRISTESICPACGLKGQMRPHVVWFGEIPLGMDEITEAVASVDLFISVGTSGNVYPAASFVEMAKSIGARTVELNLEPSENAYVFDDAEYGPASEILPRWVDEFLANNAN
ncbi:MAG: NAD-dependent deacylase [Pseudomonadota bacterium]